MAASSHAAVSRYSLGAVVQSCQVKKPDKKLAREVQKKGSSGLEIDK
jgi:hypothetical protein